MDWTIHAFRNVVVIHVLVILSRGPCNPNPRWVMQFRFILCLILACFYLMEFVLYVWFFGMGIDVL